uniref:ubiquitinyl hydrolase 1 n=1 Tax=Panthera leo TaxID=9689 RepID=A0A8C8X2K5_PANLE
MSREVTAEREAERRLKEKATLLAALKETDAAKTGRPQPPKGGKPRAPLAKDQCTCCKEKGHWKNECPNRKGPSKPSRYREEPQGKNLVGLGFTEFAVEDFHNTFTDLIEQVEKQTSVADLLASFNGQSTSDYPVVYLRLLTSGYLQRESKFFEHFIEGGRTVKEFCQQEVEPTCKESDHIHIIALAQALGVSIQVEYMDRGEGGTTNPHIFPEGSEPKVYLLYRPGHYDILYK